MSAVIKLCAAVVQQQVGRDDAEAEPWRMLALDARDEIDKLRAERRQRSEARAALHRIAVLMQCEPDDDDDLTEAVRLLVSERNEARAEVKRLQERVATQDDGLRHGEQVCARLVAERDEAMSRKENATHDR